jgi:hypothetical protein
MTRWKTLTVAEDNGHSDRLTTEYRGYYKGSGTDLRISISEKRELTISNPGGILCTPGFTTKDIDDLILYLQDAKVFLEESDILKRLLGESIWR